MRKVMQAGKYRVSYPVKPVLVEMELEAFDDSYQKCLERILKRNKKVIHRPEITHEVVDDFGPQRFCPECETQMVQTSNAFTSKYVGLGTQKSGDIGKRIMTVEEEWYYCPECLIHYRSGDAVSHATNGDIEKAISTREVLLDEIVIEDKRRIGLNVPYLRSKNLQRSVARWIDRNEEVLIDLYCNDELKEEETVEYEGSSFDTTHEEDEVANEEGTHLSNEELRRRRRLINDSEFAISEILERKTSNDDDEILLELHLLKQQLNAAKGPRIDSPYYRYLWVQGQHKDREDMRWRNFSASYRKEEEVKLFLHSYPPLKSAKEGFSLWWTSDGENGMIRVLLGHNYGEQVVHLIKSHPKHQVVARDMYQLCIKYTGRSPNYKKVRTLWNNPQDYIQKVRTSLNNLI